MNLLIKLLPCSCIANKFGKILVTDPECLIHGDREKLRSLIQKGATQNGDSNPRK